MKRRWIRCLPASPATRWPAQARVLKCCSLGAVNREDVDNYARSAGGSVFAEPGESNGFMYGCGFCDPDGHRWNPLFMDLSKLPK